MPVWQEIRRYIRRDRVPEAQCLAELIGSVPWNNRHIEQSGNNLGVMVARLIRLRPGCLSPDYDAVYAADGAGRRNWYWRHQTTITTDGTLVVATQVTLVNMPDGSTRTVAMWRATQCADCRAYIRRQDATSGIGGRYCWECAVRHVLDNRFSILAHDANVLVYFPEDAQHIRQSDHLLFGIELEVERSRRISVPLAMLVRGITERNKVICKWDGSLRDGFEINTLPLPLRQARANIQHLLAKVPRRTLVASVRCGLHIHISRRVLDDDTAARIICLVNARSMQSLVAHVARRPSNQWASISHKTMDDAQNDLRNPPGKYVAVNTQHGSTLEFRIFKASLSQATVCSALEFCAAVANFAKITEDFETLTDPRALCGYIVRHRRVFKNLTRWISRCDVGREAIEAVSRQHSLAYAA